jgi:hypothetical protein
VRGEAAERKRLVDMVDEVVAWLDLSWLRWTVRFSVKLDTDDADAVRRVAAEAVPDWEYRQATIVFWPSETVSMDDDELHAMVVHEVVHVLLAPLWVEASTAKGAPDGIGKLNELATENITRAILAVLGG